MPNAVEVTTNRLLNYSGHSGAKTELSGQKSKIVSENRKNIFREKLMPISVMTDPINQKNVVVSQEQKFSHFWLHSVSGRAPW